ncbi:lipopolysaccharide biosynthesis protein [Mitsuaria sp. GD03876]|uniref:lipopolysaccharide biosynthesis protein n=1 Tax=Mitsuaria sp. GD03876 TaxID=2975399 RepID=UPI00244A51AA|nr:lipopolysaccharide biosynthesis protein [Mitsuaria sp. GD03876]MDH0863263.1 lipopolysaccharide biosynthesis protein [Mitsuaria sp. GD03876]
MLFRNILANYIGKLWGIVSIYLFVPFYIRLLGVESYGVIAFQNVVLALMLMADAGLVPAFGREMARSQDRAYLRTLLRTLETLLLAGCALLALVVALARDWIAAHWLKGSDPALLALCIALLGATTATQLAMSLYSGGLMGLQQQARANGYAVAFSMVRSGLVLLPLWFKPDLRVYFAWQLGAALLFLALLRHALWRELGGGAGARFEPRSLRGVWAYALGMMGMAIVAALNTQMDKLVTSFALPLKDYAVYSLAGIAAQAPVMLTLPVALALLPRLTQHVEQQRRAELTSEYLGYARLITIVAVATTAFACQWAAPLVRLWTGDADLAARTAPVLQVLMLGSLLLSLQLMPYHLSLAHGHNSTNLKLGVVFLVVNPVLTYVLSQRFGLLGAATPWVFMNLVALVWLGLALHLRFVPDALRDWAWRAVTLPTAAVGSGVLAAGAAAAQLRHLGLPEGAALGVAMAATASVVVASARRQVLALLRSRHGGRAASASAPVPVPDSKPAPVSGPDHP